MHFLARWLFVCVIVLPAVSVCADTIELVSGAKVEGKVVGRDAAAITVETNVSGKSFTRKYPLDRVAAVTVDGQREVLNASGPAKEPAAGRGRTKAQIEALIDEQGRTPPDWFEQTALNYPQTLDLSWPPPPQGWNNQRNLGQYIWDIINPNQGRWREGVKLMHHVLTVNKNNPDVQRRAMGELGRMYFVLLQDYPRAAFWWRKANGEKGDAPGSDAGVRLAECYWRLGNKDMAVELLGKLPASYGMIKLWADMGDARRALQMAESNAKGPFADVALIYAGDACRVNGMYKEAIGYFQQALKISPTGQGKGRIERNQRRAAANIEAIKLFELLDLTRVADGTYRAASPGYETNVSVEVVVTHHRIESVKVTDHREKQYYASMIDVPRKIVEKQSVKGIDAVSSATITSEAIVNATAKALAAAMK
jgi:uncharacterized protein with FMN-binding domain